MEVIWGYMSYGLKLGRGGPIGGCSGFRGTLRNILQFWSRAPKGVIWGYMRVTKDL